MNRNEGFSEPVRLSILAELTKNRAALEQARQNNDVKKQQELIEIITRQERALSTMGGGRPEEPKP